MEERFWISGLNNIKFQLLSFCHLKIWLLQNSKLYIQIIYSIGYMPAGSTMTGNTVPEMGFSLSAPQSLPWGNRRTEMEALTRTVILLPDS